jgi:hypothetical protein
MLPVVANRPQPRQPTFAVNRLILEKRPILKAPPTAGLFSFSVQQTQPLLKPAGLYL